MQNNCNLKMTTTRHMTTKIHKATTTSETHKMTTRRQKKIKKNVKQLQRDTKRPKTDERPLE